MSLEDEFTRLDVAASAGKEQDSSTVLTVWQKAAAKNKQRLQRLEQQRARLKASEKWPTNKSIRVYEESGRKFNVCIVEPLCEHRSCQVVHQFPSNWQYDLAWRSYEMSSAYIPAPDQFFEPSESPKEDFPFPISTSQRRIPAKSDRFELFLSPPTEIRIQVWEMELRRPRFLEVHFAAQTGLATLRHPCAGRENLLTACHESRATAPKATLEYLHNGPPYGGMSLDEKRRHFSEAVFFRPDIDTIFSRPIDSPSAGLKSVAWSMHHANKIQHLAVPLAEAGWGGCCNRWKRGLARLTGLKTPTLMVGGREFSWLDSQEIELKNVEEWFADGRWRLYKCDGWGMDITDIVRYLGGKLYEERLRGPGHVSVPHFRVNVRAVAWEKDEDNR